MKFFLLMVIRVYWLVTPVHARRSCLFKESCSRYVYRVTAQEGFLKGIRALYTRWKHCRSGYALYEDDAGTSWVLFKDGTVVERNSTVI